MNKPITLCDRCEKAAECLLNFDGIPCRKNRTVEPTNYDLLISKTPEELAKFLHDMTLISQEIGLSVEWWEQWLKSPVEGEQT